MNNQPLTGRQQLGAFVACALVVGGFLAPGVHAQIKDVVKPGDWMLIPVFAVGLVFAIPLMLFFQNILALFVGLAVVGVVKLVAPLVPKRFRHVPFGRALAQGTKILTVIAAIGILLGLYSLALERKGGGDGHVGAGTTGVGTAASDSRNGHAAATARRPPEESSCQSR